MFGFHSIIDSKVHSSLLSAENALQYQSLEHPDGWGIGYYLEQTPHLIRAETPAIEDHIFRKVSGVVSSQTVLAHIRKATQGQSHVLNSHPFQFGKWLFAHNGNIKDFNLRRNELLKLVDRQLAPFILGSTDSEVLFFIILTSIKKNFSLSQADLPMEDFAFVLEKTLKEVTDIIGPLTSRIKPATTENYLSFLLTNGKNLLGYHGGQPLYYCTHKTKCPERESCAHFSDSCENKSLEGKRINHLILSSEKVQGPNVWQELAANSFVAVDSQMTLFKKTFKVALNTSQN